MTKEEIKETIARRTEEAWQELCGVTDFFGAGSLEATNVRGAWYALNKLYEELYGDEK